MCYFFFCLEFSSMAVETEESGMSGTVPLQLQGGVGLSVIDPVPPQSPEGLRASVIDSVPPQSPEALRASIIDSVPPKFPEGLRVLAVDDDQTCLRIVARMLERCMYQGIFIIPTSFLLSRLIFVYSQGFMFVSWE